MNVCKGTVIVDTSYVVFAKWYSALSWYKMSINRNPEVDNLLESSVFKSKVASMFEQNVMKVLKQRDVPDAYLIFAKDCNRQSVWRRDHFDNYKEGRSHTGNFNSEVFHYVYSAVIPSILERHRGCMIGVDNAEADDVIGVLATHLRESLPGEKIVIITNDNDCIQLVDENTTAVNLCLQDIGSRRGDLTPGQYLRSRILSGDRSDNIPSIVPRCGPKTAARIVQEYGEEELREMYKTQYDKNDLLMNLRNTPGDLKRNILEKYHIYARFREGDQPPP